jgi:hypothetical protein
VVCKMTGNSTHFANVFSNFARHLFSFFISDIHLMLWIISYITVNCIISAFQAMNDTAFYNKRDAIISAVVWYLLSRCWIVLNS